MEDYSLTPPICVPHARFSALHHAALGGSLELIALLLEAQATVDIKDSNGESLMYGTMWGKGGRSLLQPWGPALAPVWTYRERCVGSFLELMNGFLLERACSSDLPLFG